MVERAAPNLAHTLSVITMTCRLAEAPTTALTQPGRRIGTPSKMGSGATSTWARLATAGPACWGDGDGGRERAHLPGLQPVRGLERGFRRGWDDLHRRRCLLAPGDDRHQRRQPAGQGIRAGRPGDVPPEPVRPERHANLLPRRAAAD